jgi:transcriptional regulator with XRE-family HTH domain
MSLKDLAYEIGMEPSNLSVIENGRSNPQLLTYAKIASALNSNLKELFSIEFDYDAFSESKSTYKPRKHS